MTANRTVTFTLPESAAIALSADDPGMWPDAVTLTPANRRVTITTTVRTAKLMLSDAVSRAEPPVRGEGWDQPASWRRACGVAVERIRTALAQL